jgi:hypothetical protein
VSGDKNDDWDHNAEGVFMIGLIYSGEYPDRVKKIADPA